MEELKPGFMVKYEFQNREKVEVINFSAFRFFNIRLQWTKTLFYFSNVLLKQEIPN